MGAAEVYSPRLICCTIHRAPRRRSSVASGSPSSASRCPTVHLPVVVSRDLPSVGWPLLSCRLSLFHDGRRLSGRGDGGALKVRSDVISCRFALWRTRTMRSRVGDERSGLWLFCCCCHFLPCFRSSSAYHTHHTYHAYHTSI